jgi:hypothetical protein
LLILAPDIHKGEQWSVVAHLRGRIVPMTPKHFPVCGSYEEAIERARLKLSSDPEFAGRWWGWHFAGMRVDHQVTSGAHR